MCFQKKTSDRYFPCYTLICQESAVVKVCIYVILRDTIDLAVQVI